MTAQLEGKTKYSADLPIGFVDSGLGGISVLKEAVKLMPQEDFVYYGDSLHAPYGVRPTQEIKNLTYAAADILFARGIKGLAVACNTATSAAVRQLRIDYPDLPIVGIEPAVKPAVEAGGGGRILVMATPMTIKQEKFCNLLARYEKQADIVPVPCEGLMEFVEKGDLESDFLNQYFQEILLPYMTADIETIVLGCTHYPFLRPHLRDFLQEKEQECTDEAHRGRFGRIRLIDGSLGTARELRRRLSEKGLLREKRTSEEAHITFLNSMPGEEMIERSWKLLRLPID